MLKSSMKPTTSCNMREDSILKEVRRVSYCPRCLKSSHLFCASCKRQAFSAVFYLHNVPKINGFEESDDECAACKLMKRPQRDFNEIHLCERELQNIFEQPITERNLCKVIEQVDYFVDCSGSAILIECPSCCQVVARSDFEDHMCN